MRELIALVVVASSGCAVHDASIVARYPWVEHACVALAHETLSIEVHDGVADVDAWFRFEGEGALPTRMRFPIGRGDGDVIAFEATMEQEGAAPIALDVTVVDAFVRDIDLPPNLDARRTRLRARYQQSVARSFRYVLESGARWAGPIGALEVVVRDPEARIATALVEGAIANHAEKQAWKWSFVDLEPRGGVAIELR